MSVPLRSLSAFKIKDYGNFLVLFTSLYLSLSFFSAHAKEVDFLELSLNELMKVQIETAGKRKQNIEDIAQTAYVITAQQIDENGYTSIAEALNTLPGFNMERDWYLDRLVVRGVVLTKEKLLLMIDGQAMTMKSDNYNIINGGAPIGIGDIERIEVIVGPNSTLYGSGAFVGVVNVLTKTAQQGLQIKTSASSVNERGVYMSLGEKIADMNLTLTADFQESDGDKLDFSFLAGAPPDYQLREGRADGFNTLKSNRFSAKLEFDSLVIRGQYSDSEIGWPSSNFATDFNDHGNKYEIVHKSLQAKYTQQFNAELQGAMRVYYNDAVGAWKGIYEGELWLAPTGELYGGKYYGAEYKLVYTPSELMSVVSGIEYTKNYDVQSVGYIRDFKNYSVFTMVDYLLSSKWSINIGGRAEKYSFRQKAELMPQFGVVYKFIDNASLKFAYGRGFKAPSTWEVQIAETVKNDNLKPEIFDSYELNYEHNFRHWLSNLSIFYAEQSNKITPHYQGNTVVSITNSSEHRKYQGIDWHGNVVLSKLSSMKLGLSYVDTEETDDFTLKKNDIAGVAKTMAYLILRMKLADNSVLTLQNKFISAPSNVDDFDPTNRVDVSWLKKNFYGLDVGIKIGNLLNANINTYSREGIVERIPDYGRYFSLSLSKIF
ncbi:TonB-dependent receptor plug domain-containing protein [Colwelliaceae bacterium 6471]